MTTIAFPFTGTDPNNYLKFLCPHELYEVHLNAPPRPFVKFQISSDASVSLWQYLVLIDCS